jgi:hypothetical protein
MPLGASGCRGTIQRQIRNTATEPARRFFVGRLFTPRTLRSPAISGAPPSPALPLPWGNLTRFVAGSFGTAVDARMTVVRAAEFVSQDSSSAISPRLFLQRIRGAITVAIARHARLGDHIDIRIDTAILRIAVTDLEYPGRTAGFIDEVVAIGVAGSERRTIAGTQHFLATVGDQRQIALEHPHQFVLMAVPVTLAGPGAGLDDGQIHAELSQTRIACEPLRRLIEARPVEGRRIVALGLNGYCSERNLFGHKHNYTAQGQTAARVAGQIEALPELSAHRRPLDRSLPDEPEFSSNGASAARSPQEPTRLHDHFLVTLLRAAPNSTREYST